jgi:hypothetical protein
MFTLQLLRPQQQQQQKAADSWEPDADQPCFVECVMQVCSFAVVWAQFVYA